MSTNNIHSEINNTPLKAIINKVIEGFHNGKAIVVFKGNRTIVLSNKVHNESTLIKYLNNATTVRICA